MKLLKKILRGHRAWITNEPTAWDVRDLLNRHPDTTVVTCSRRAASLVNDLVMKVEFQHKHKKPMAELPLDWEVNPENYGADGKLQPNTTPAPTMTTMYAGMTIVLTKNLNKKQDFVNGMQCTVESYDEHSGCLTVVTCTGKTLAIAAVAEAVEGMPGKVLHFPARVGYACTIPKIQGQTLPHITIWLDVPGCPAAGYVAMARVQHDGDYLVAGRICRNSFAPAH